MNIKLVMFLLGRVSFIFGLSLFAPLITALVFEENKFVEYGIPLFISLVLGYILTKGKNPYRGRLTLREGLAVVGCSSIFLCVMGLLPYYYIGFDPISAFFESVSGFTTTGASVISDPMVLPPSVLLWRSLTQWLGGAGIILVFVTLAPQVGSDAAQIFTAELHGESSERIMPRITKTVYALGVLYFLFTLVVAILLMFVGMSGFEALMHAMATVSTGGFSIYKQGITHFNNMGIEIILMFFMFLAGGNYVLYYKVYKKGFSVIKKDTEFKAYIGVVVVFALMIATDLFFSGYYNLSGSVFYSLFQTISFVSTTGFYAQDYNNWPDFSRFCLLLLMFVGGCAGSTAGGIKIARLVLLFKLTWAELKRTIHPHMVFSIKMVDKNISSVMLAGITRFFFLYMTIFAFLTLFISLASDLEILSAISIIASCMANIGPGFDIVSPCADYGLITNTGKILACLAMLLGRLEIFTLIIFLSPDFWRSNKNW